MASFLNYSRIKRYRRGFQNGLRGVPLVLAFIAIAFFGLHVGRAIAYMAAVEFGTTANTHNFSSVAQYAHLGAIVLPGGSYYDNPAYKAVSAEFLSLWIGSSTLAWLWTGQRHRLLKRHPSRPRITR